MDEVIRMPGARFALPWLAATMLAQSPADVEDAARQVMQANCLACHGSARMSGLDLRSRETILKGGTRGPAVKPGEAVSSLLMQAVRGEGPLKMPPGKAALSAAELGALSRWIDVGAPWRAGQAADVSWWSFRKPARPELPAATARARNEIDRFIFSKLASLGLEPAPAADRRTLIRRATFDLHGLPPTPEEVEKFVQDSSGNAYEKLIDRLLESPRHGERWSRHWLDVVRYADTGGFETDHYFANAWRYRDYVIQSLNRDKPYNVFVQEQVAGDEIWPDDLSLEGAYEIPKSKLANLERRIATGLYTLGAFPVEITFWGEQQRAEWQAEAVDTTGAAFLGLSLACARCHDHKFDPISQRDYYRMAALFAGSEDREVPIVSPMGIYEFTRHQTRWVAVDQLKARLQRLDAAARRRTGAPDPDADDTPRNIRVEYTPAERDERESLLRQIGDAYVKAPAPVAKANMLVHYAPVPDTHVLARGEWLQKGDKVPPGFPGALSGEAAIEEPATGWFIPRRRKALAEWLTSPDHPLTARVMVNRIWQGHFGRGLVGTSNDFGRQGEPPSHPELLDWLAREFVERGWSLKALHRLIMNSDAYRMSSQANATGLAKDPDNRYLWRMNRRRLEAESIRDAVLASAGVLNLRTGGPPVVPPLTPEEREGMRDPSQWPVTADAAEHNRRSVYLFVKRSFRMPMMEAFDAPDPAASCARRETSTVAPQSLTLMNSTFMNEQAERFAARLRKEAGESAAAQVERGWRLALGRAPSAAESRRGVEFLARHTLARYGLLLFNLSEFLYVD